MKIESLVVVSLALVTSVLGLAQDRKLEVMGSGGFSAAYRELSREFSEQLMQQG